MFVKFCNNPRGNLRAGDCVIRAICAATGDTWEKIYTELSAEGYYQGDWANNNGVWDSYLRRRGYKRYICPNDCPSCYSVADFAADHPQGVYILGTGHHAVTVKHGDWLDSWDSGSECPIYYYTKE